MQIDRVVVIRYFLSCDLVTRRHQTLQSIDFNDRKEMSHLFIFIFLSSFIRLPLISFRSFQKRRDVDLMDRRGDAVEE